MELELLIKFFDSYPLITHKLADYTLWKRIFNLMQHDLHLTMRGLRKIVALKAKMNRGLSNVLTFTFTNVQPIAWPLVKSQSSLDPNWVAGFASGEGCFAVIIQASSKYKIVPPPPHTPPLLIFSPFRIPLFPFPLSRKGEKIDRGKGKRGIREWGGGGDQRGPIGDPPPVLVWLTGCLPPPSQ